jgi:hypothetical protein
MYIDEKCLESAIADISDKKCFKLTLDVSNLFSSEYYGPYLMSILCENTDLDTLTIAFDVKQNPLPQISLSMKIFHNKSNLSEITIQGITIHYDLLKGVLAIKPLRKLKIEDCDIDRRLCYMLFISFISKPQIERRQIIREYFDNNMRTLSKETKTYIEDFILKENIQSDINYLLVNLSKTRKVKFWQTDETGLANFLVLEIIKSNTNLKFLYLNFPWYIHSTRLPKRLEENFTLFQTNLFNCDDILRRNLRLNDTTRTSSLSLILMRKYRKEELKLTHIGRLLLMLDSNLLIKIAKLCWVQLKTNKLHLKELSHKENQ